MHTLLHASRITLPAPRSHISHLIDEAVPQNNVLVGDVSQVDGPSHYAVGTQIRLGKTVMKQRSVLYAYMNVCM